MLYTNEGNTRIEGSVATVLADLSVAIKSIKECLEERDYDDEFIRENIAQCGRVAFMTDEERKAEAAEKLARLAKEIGVGESDIKSAVEFIMSMSEDDEMSMREDDEENKED